MEVMHRISFPGEQSYEQHTAEFTISETDVKADVLKECNLLEKMFIFNTLVLFEGLLFQLAENFIDEKEMKKRKARIFGLLNPKLKDIIKEILSDGSDRNKDAK